MIELNLTANTEPEKRILEYLQNNVSEFLADKINNGTPFEKDGKQLINKKTLSDFMKYACDEARKLAEKGANSACIEDSVVYGWAIHYFEEESIVGTLYNADGTEYKPVVKAAAKPITKPVVTETKPKQVQWSLFDMVNETAQESEVKDTANDTLNVRFEKFVYGLVRIESHEMAIACGIVKRKSVFISDEPHKLVRYDDCVYIHTIYVRLAVDCAESVLLRNVVIHFGYGIVVSRCGIDCFIPLSVNRRNSVISYCIVFDCKFRNLILEKYSVGI